MTSNAQAARWERPRLAGSATPSTPRSLFNPRVRKEVRLLAPYFAGSLVCIAMIWVGVYYLPDRGAPQWLTLLFPMIAVIGAAVLPVALCACAVISFTSEFQNNTLSQLLVQPVDRVTLWLEKFILTTAAVVLPAIIAVVSFLLVGYAARQDVGLLGILASPIVAAALVIACAGQSLAIRFKSALPALLALLGYILLNFTLVAFFTRGLLPISSDDSLASIAIIATFILSVVAVAESYLGYRAFQRLEV